MIDRLILTGFGRFTHAVFELDGVTLVYGPNEAGKTTFFDGLFQALCRPSETKKYGRVLKARYGPGRAAQVVLSQAGKAASALDLPISDEEFMNLYAIREGDLRLELDKGTEWLDKLKARLFNGGLDQSWFAAEFEKRSSDSRTLTHSKELEKAKEAADKAKRELESKQRERDSVLAREKNLTDTEAALSAARGLVHAEWEKLSLTDSLIAAEEKIALRQRWDGHLARLEEWEALEAENKAYLPYGQDRREELQILSQARAQAAAAMQGERGRREQQEQQVSQAKQDLNGLRASKTATDDRAQTAEKLAASVRAYLQTVSEPGRLPLWSRIAITLALIAGAAGSVVGILFGDWKSAAAAVLIGLPLAVLAYFTGRRARTAAKLDDGITRLASWKDEWNLTAAASPAGTGVGDMGTVEGFLRAMEAVAREKEAYALRESEALARLESAQAGLEKIEAASAGLRDMDALAARREKEWLAGLGVGDAEAYAEKVSRARQIRQELGKRRSELETLADGADLETFRREARRRLHAMDEEGIPQRGLDEAALQRLRKQGAEIRQRYDSALRREGELAAQREGLAGEIRGAFGSLAADLVECEERLAQAERDVQTKELDKRAAALAGRIFRDIGDGADRLLGELAMEIESMLAGILPAGRAVALSGFEDRQIQVIDAGGGLRSLDQLSTGTKHALVLAAKLAMALKQRQGPGLLVLDEPFTAMDQERESRALELLRQFHASHGWQILLLTKDAALVERATRIFTNPKVLDLAGYP
ncbi:MAG: AAA family ATPase [Fibrobacteria bacterium]